MKLNFLLFMLCTFFISCKPQGPEAKWIYGSWYEKLDGGKIEFKKGGKVIWLGQSGTFSFEKNSTLICGGGGCMDGEIKVKAAGDTFRFGYNVNKGKPKPEMMTMRFQKYGGLSKTHLIQGKKTNVFYLSSVFPSGTSYKIKNFQRMDKGLYKYNSMSNSAIVNGKLVANIWWGEPTFASFNKGTNSWSVYDSSLIDGIGSLYFGKEVIINSYFNSTKYSLDTGASWKKLPKLENEVGYSSGFYESAFLGKKVFNLEQDPVPEGGNWEDPRLYKIFSIDLSQASSRWEKIYDLPVTLTTNLYNLKMYSCENKKELYILANPVKNENSGLKAKMYRSQNGGQSFTEIDLPELNQLGQAKASSNGLITVGWKSVNGKNEYTLNFFNSENFFNNCMNKG